MSGLVVILALFLLFYLVDKGIEKSLGVERKKLSETTGKRADFWGRTIIVLIFVGLFPVILSVVPESFLVFYSFLLLTVLFIFQAFLEWKYMRETKQYIATLISSLILLVVLLSALHFYS